MSKYVEIQTGKLIGRNGGVGSIIETIHGAIKIEPFNNWNYFASIKHEKIEPKIIEDKRLLERLKNYFPRIEKMVKIPENYLDIFRYNQPKDKYKIINSRYFPKWMYCNKCERFRNIKDWWEGWRNIYIGPKETIRDSFVPPKCFYCYKDALKEGKKRKYFNLEQVRFIMTSPDGKIRDIPWDRWPTIKKVEKESDSDGGSLKFSLEKKICCDNQDLRYKKSPKLSDLAGIWIECKNCGKKNTLFGLFGLRLPSGFVKDENGETLTDDSGDPIALYFKPVIRTSNSVYYPILINSIFIPEISGINPKLEKLVISFHEMGYSNQDIYNILKEKYTIKLNEIEKLICPSSLLTENEYRLREFLFLSSNFPRYMDSNLSFEYIQNSSVLKKFGINKFIKINKLKLTTVQTGYTRQEPLDKDLFEKRDSDYIQVSRNKIIKINYTSTFGNMTNVLPAVENYGEGIFIDLDKDVVDDWFKKYWNISNRFKKRINKLANNSKKSDFRKSTEKVKMINNYEYLSKYILVHTLSHILIKEFEFLVGYSSSSLSERLYIDSNNMQGLLIYTISGSSGSYGGLVSQCEANKFEKILKSALFRAKDCSSDPICYNSDGQGVGGLNLAACFSCALLPETSCEEFNTYLDRAFLIDDEFGFFSLLTK